jgi:O-antigen/teichoic acid export membrane protein
LSLYKSLFKQTAIYGLATVIPRLISFLLNPLYVYYLTDMNKMGEVSVIFSYLVFFNVLLSYGMETAFFRFYNSEDKKENVVTTSMISLLVSTLIFFGIAMFFKEDIVLVFWVIGNILCQISLYRVDIISIDVN